VGDAVAVQLDHDRVADAVRRVHRSVGIGDDTLVREGNAVLTEERLRLGL
jgi:hypothetical protein